MGVYARSAGRPQPRLRAVPGAVCVALLRGFRTPCRPGHTPGHDSRTNGGRPNSLARINARILH